jgi:hypothetical protein
MMAATPSPAAANHLALPGSPQAVPASLHADPPVVQWACLMDNDEKITGIFFHWSLACAFLFANVP